MAGAQGRRELLEVVAQQKEQISRYETRLKDVVRAYKGLAKEKETLETSLKAITAAVQEESEREEATDTDCEAGSTAGSESSASAPKLAALSSSLASVASEKAQSEAKFLADKRRMKKERDELVVELTAVKKTEEELRTSVEESKSKLIIEKHEREKEINNNKLMIQEMQKLLSEERRKSEKLVEDLLEAKSKVITLEDPSKSKEFEHQIRALQIDLESAKKQVARGEKQLREQGATEQSIAVLRMEMEEMKRKHWEQLHSADTARERAELRVLEVQSSQERRVGNLEARLQELSGSVGNYEKLRQHDQAAITCMREEIDVLHSENQELSRAATASPPAVVEEPNVDRALEQVARLKAFLLEAVGEEKLREVFLLPEQEDLVEKCRRLQEKLVSLEVTASPSSKLEDFLSKQSSSEEVLGLRVVQEELQARVASLRQRCGEQERLLADRQLAAVEQRQEGERELEAQRLEARKQVTALRLEVQEQRERCLALLEEKDRELEKLRGQVETAVEEAFYSPRPEQRGSRESSKSPLAALPRRVSVEVKELGRQDSQGSIGPPLHYLQELARKEVELKELRSQQYQAETGLREIQLTMSAKEEKYQVYPA